MFSEQRAHELGVVTFLGKGQMWLYTAEGLEARAPRGTLGLSSAPSPCVGSLTQESPESDTWTQVSLKPMRKKTLCYWGLISWMGHMFVRVHLYI